MDDLYKQKRFKDSPRKINTNSEMNVKELGTYAPLDDETKSY